MFFLLLALVGCGGVDSDGDGWVRRDDCDDHDPGIGPDAAEYCDDIDQDCDGLVADPESVDAQAWWVDRDGDGFGDTSNASLVKACTQPSGFADNNLDCDDDDDDVNPDATEIPGNGADDDCDTSTPD